MLKKIMKICLVVVILFVIFFIGSINYFANNIICFDRVPLTNEKPANPNDLGLHYFDEKIKFKKNGFCNGWYIPSGIKTQKLVILVHGRESNKSKLLKYVSFLNQAQYNVFLMDFRNSGDSYYAPCSMGYYESKELVAAVKYLKEKYRIKKIAIMGFSMGGATTVLALQDIKNIHGIKVNAIVLDSTYSSLREIIQYRTQNKKIYNEKYFDLVLNYIGWRLKFDVDEVDLIKVLNKITDLSVFIIHGDKDDLVFQDNSRKIFNSLNIFGGKEEAWFPHNVEHTKAFDEYPEEYKKRVLNFLKSAEF